jgi:ArsR family transcriptional regulator
VTAAAPLNALAGIINKDMARTPTKAKAKTKLTDEQFTAISRAVSDPRRFAILRQVAATQAPEGMPCGRLQEHTVISAATISHHLKELSEAGLIVAERDGRCSNLTLDRQMWQAYLDRLNAL